MYVHMYTYTSIYPAKSRPGIRTAKLYSGAQMHLIRSPIEGYGPHPQASTRLACAAVVPQANVRRPWGIYRNWQFCTVFGIFTH